MIYKFIKLFWTIYITIIKVVTALYPAAQQGHTACDIHIEEDVVVVEVVK